MLVRVIGGHGGISPGFKASSYLIDGKLLLDAGSVASGIQVAEQLLIDNILISHSHLDHISDLAFMADNCFGQKGKPFEIYANKVVKENIINHLFNDAIWPDFSAIPTKKNPTLRFHDIVEEETIMIGGYNITPVAVNHSEGAVGFIIEKKGTAIVFTQDTGPTERIWELSKKVDNLKAIFTEVSFPNKLLKVAQDSWHHTPDTIRDEIPKMPKDVPIFLGHLKPNFQDEIIAEVGELNIDRVCVLGDDDTSFVF